MQDKIQEIMQSVVWFALLQADAREWRAIHGDNEQGQELYERAKEAHSIVESKLRELVREPLPYEQAWSIAATSDSALDAIRKAERAHGITKEGE